jgi:uncharacterized membrane protein YccC
MALVTALGAGLMAAMHIDTVLGMYVLWSIVSGPAAMMRPATGLTLIAATATAVTASVPLAGALVEAPWLLLTFFAVAAALSTYSFTDAQLTDGWRMVQILFLTTFWIAVFDPAFFGWSTAYAFAGASVAFVLVMLFDNVLWPDPAERRLLDSIAASVETIRARLAAVGRAYLERTPAAAAAGPHPSLSGAMNAHLALLSRAEREGLSPRRRALLLEAVGVTERLRLEVERLLMVAREAVPRQSRQLIAPELEALLGTIDSALARETNELRAGFHEVEGARPDTAGLIYAALDAYNRRVNELLSQFTAQARADEMSNLSAFVVGLERMARLFIHTPIPLREAAVGPTAGAATHAAETARGVTRMARPAADAARKRYCLKLAAATALAFVVGLATHRADLTTILWTVMIAGLPTYGASLRKMILRFVGAALGGALALLAIIAVSPNFETVLTYILICFVALFVCAYLGESSGSLSYPGKQAGTSFVLVFVGLSPSVREYEPLWRLWGIFLGIIVITIVFIVLWPEYAGDSLVPRLERMLEMILALMPRTVRGLSERQVEAMEIDAAQILGELLAVADDARIEGRRCGFDPDAVIDAVGTLRRIAHRLASIASGRGTQPPPQLAPHIQAARDRVEDALRTQFEVCLDYVRRRAATRQNPRTEWNGEAVGTLLDGLHEAIAADSFAAIASWPIEERRALLAEIEAFRRLVILTGELSEQLSRIAPPAFARRRRLVERPATA